MSRKTEYVPLSGLTPDPRNPKSHSLEVIDASVGRFGVIDQIAVDGRTGYIISGHGRTKTLAAMKERGESPPEGVQVSDDGEWLVPVTTGWSSRTDSEAAAALIALNRTTELGGWVDEDLLGLLDDLADMEDGLDGVGFTPSEIETLSKIVDQARMVDEWEGSGQSGDEGDTDISKIGFSDSDTEEVRVLVKIGHRASVYEALKDLPGLVDIRDPR